MLLQNTRCERAKRRFRLLVEGVRDYAIFMLDQTGRMSSWNIGAQLIKGYMASEIIGSHFSIFYPPEALADGKPERELRIATAEGQYEEEGWRVRKDGSLFWAHVLITALYDSHGVLRGFGKVTRDMTERKRAQEQRDELREREQQLQPEREARSQTLNGYYSCKMSFWRSRRTSFAPRSPRCSAT